MASFKDDTVTELHDCKNIEFFINTIPHNRSYLICLHVNIRSIILRFSALEQLIHSAKIQLDVLVITEANISDKLSSLYNLEGYQMHTKLRKDRKGGGIIIYIHKSHKYSVTDTNTIYSESALLKITTPTNYSTKLLAIYRPPDTSKHLFIDELQSTIKKQGTNHDFLLLGDINLNIANDSPIKHKYCSILSSLGFVCGNACNYRDELFLQWKNDSNNMILKLKYNKARNAANKIIQKTRNSHIRSEIINQKGNTKRMWQILNRITYRKISKLH